MKLEDITVSREERMNKLVVGEKLSSMSERQLQYISCPKPTFECCNQLRYYNPKLHIICYERVDGQ